MRCSRLSIREARTTQRCRPICHQGASWFPRGCGRSLASVTQQRIHASPHTYSSNVQHDDLIEPLYTRGELSPRRPLLLGVAATLAALLASQGRSAQAIENADVVVGTTTLTNEVSPSVTSSVDSGNTSYKDAKDQFQLSIPADWLQAEGAIGTDGGFSGAGAGSQRRTVAFFPPDRRANEVNVTVTITNVSFEFTKLGSFGNVASFASNLVNSLDRSYLLRSPAWARKSTEPVQVAKLVDYRDANDEYMIEYTVQKLPEPQRHLLSKLALGSNGRYNRLYTLTAQCREEDLLQYRAVFDTALDTFHANVKPLV